jgi:kynurenine formamidase
MTKSLEVRLKVSMDDIRALPSQAEVLSYFSELSNAGRWGEDDEIGTLNLVTPSKRVESAQLVRDGVALSLAWDIDPKPGVDDVVGPPQRFMLTTGEGLGDAHRVPRSRSQGRSRQSGAAEYLGIPYHGFRVTHLDALSHIFWDRKMYNDVPAEFVTSHSGATKNAVTGLRDGIVTRGILLDAAASRGVSWMERGDAVMPEELDKILEASGLEVEPGDALLLRTGYGSKRIAQGRDDIRRHGQPGWHAACLPWLRSKDVALIAADTSQDAAPSGYPEILLPIHAVGITALGLCLVDNCDLERLSLVCSERKRWEFQLVIAPLPFVGATGSPINPLAIL